MSLPRSVVRSTSTVVFLPLSWTRVFETVEVQRSIGPSVQHKNAKQGVELAKIEKHETCLDTVKSFLKIATPDDPLTLKLLIKMPLMS